ncbi:MAG TPA: pyridoxal-phosphate dependent enzyme, partial [Thermoanaerobaculia bacterium]|nr:pyridoxal-phosphate dependent enzyme [Thermoanaerobaculia bacterium]
MANSMSRTEMESARAVVAPHVRRTPVIEIPGSDLGLDGCTLLFKLEYLQHSGSFKARGAFANLLLREVPDAGVVAASGGNHGVAVAYAAMRLGVRAKIFVPTIASPAKIARIRGYGAELVITGDRYADALAASEVWAADSGA